MPSRARLLRTGGSRCWSCEDVAATCPRLIPVVWRTVVSTQIAKRQAVVNPENTFFSVKRFIGRKMEEVKDESKQVPYQVRILTA